MKTVTVRIDEDVYNEILNLEVKYSMRKQAVISKAIQLFSKLNELEIYRKDENGNLQSVIILK